MTIRSSKIKLAKSIYKEIYAELCPTFFTFYPAETEKPTSNEINNKISIFLIDINEGRRVSANEVWKIESLPR